MLLVPIKAFRGFVRVVVQKLLVRIGNIEARQDEIEVRVQKIEKNVVTSDYVKKMIKEEIAEEKEIASRKSLVPRV